MFTRRTVHLLLVGVAMAMTVVTASCAGAASATFPVPPPGGLVTLPAEAVARVIANEPRLTGIQPFDSGLIGQSNWYTVEPASGVGAFIVTVRIGWGDCEAGCIEEHTWTVAVAPDGALTILSETGQPVPEDAWPSPLGAGQTGIAGVALAGPACPVESVPPDPDCAPRPVAGATIVIHDAAGSEVAQTVTDADGSFFLTVPAGDYTVVPRPVEGLMGTAATIDVTVRDGIATQVQLDYDTGIR
jgi:Carboxypeptidase regulatory-like domain